MPSSRVAAIPAVLFLLTVFTNLDFASGSSSRTARVRSSLSKNWMRRSFAAIASRTACSSAAKTDSVSGTWFRAGRRNALAGLMFGSANVVFANDKALAVRPLEPAIIDSYASIKPRNILITGANSGIGRSAVAFLAKAGHTVYAVSRTMDKAEKSVDEIKAELGENLRGLLHCDLSDLDDVRSFVQRFRSLGVPLNVLVANAGLSLGAYDKNTKPKLTKQGFELTVGTNYLGHFLLVNLLLDELEKSGPDSRIVITGSEVHDPSSPGGQVGAKATLGDLSGLDEDNWNMIDGGAYDPDKAYKDSKLADIMFALELQRRLTASGKHITVNSFGPGLITRSGFFRNQAQGFTQIFDFAATNIFHVTETVDFGGACIAYMAVSKDLDNVGGKWYNAIQPGEPKLEELQPSAEAQDTKKARKLFDRSADLVGFSV
eukprot:CAMPEP_0114510940 /NCGR_PEP_ID=MMETSP0109-20121206/14079_1 /TAXON_ID=29199 /ORGANISM="Chlorarachnion reptans, Strain CCCM449" /LENGTH=431 /DNA_ID=CAMNT_0001690329 /DNA_START=140 /DNA_END=1435 /DNA_ORIENTATION=-